ncbi:unnamed protein product [Tuber melanosporum]|uniref:(Perigord truffle) hypothetical protein n=1 Tax=Tuber melanosporum (strain Mel28) TaxID=656061 RepID=D5GI17_TUBMM|nr:uncharacterized protein GSTUM_00008229001 [Tuber melanosporum]CAZ84160.1 unnamed protein product [Tuber melanosporum]
MRVTRERGVYTYDFLTRAPRAAVEFELLLLCFNSRGISQSRIWDRYRGDNKQMGKSGISLIR